MSNVGKFDRGLVSSVSGNKSDSSKKDNDKNKETNESTEQFNLPGEGGIPEPGGDGNQEVVGPVKNKVLFGSLDEEHPTVKDLAQDAQLTEDEMKVADFLNPDNGQAGFALPKINDPDELNKSVEEISDNKVGPENFEEPPDVGDAAVAMWKGIGSIAEGKEDVGRIKQILNGAENVAELFRGAKQFIADVREDPNEVIREGIEKFGSKSLANTYQTLGIVNQATNTAVEKESEDGSFLPDEAKVAGAGNQLINTISGRESDNDFLFQSSKNENIADAGIPQQQKSEQTTSDDTQPKEKQTNNQKEKEEDAKLRVPNKFAITPNNGATIEQIAERFNKDPGKIRELSGIEGEVQSGQKVFLPMDEADAQGIRAMAQNSNQSAEDIALKKDVVTFGEQEDSGQQQRQDDGTESVTQQQETQSISTNQNRQNANVVDEVKLSEGETMWDIAQRYENVSTDDLVRLNSDLGNPRKLDTGTTIKVGTFTGDQPVKNKTQGEQDGGGLTEDDVPQPSDTPDLEDGGQQTVEPTNLDAENSMNPDFGMSVGELTGGTGDGDVSDFGMSVGDLTGTGETTDRPLISSNEVDQVTSGNDFNLDNPTQASIYNSVQKNIPIVGALPEEEKINVNNIDNFSAQEIIENPGKIQTSTSFLEQGVSKINKSSTQQESQSNFFNALQGIAGVISAMANPQIYMKFQEMKSKRQQQQFERQQQKIMNKFRRKKLQFRKNQFRVEQKNIENEMDLRRKKLQERKRQFNKELDLERENITNEKINELTNKITTLQERIDKTEAEEKQKIRELYKERVDNLSPSEATIDRKRKELNDVMKQFPAFKKSLRARNQLSDFFRGVTTRPLEKQEKEDVLEWFESHSNEMRSVLKEVARQGNQEDINNVKEEYLREAIKKARGANLSTDRTNRLISFFKLRAEQSLPEEEDDQETWEVGEGGTKKEVPKPDGVQNHIDLISDIITKDPNNVRSDLARGTLNTYKSLEPINQKEVARKVGVGRESLTNMLNDRISGGEIPEGTVDETVETARSEYRSMLSQLMTIEQDDLDESLRNNLGFRSRSNFITGMTDATTPTDAEIREFYVNNPDKDLGLLRNAVEQAESANAQLLRSEVFTDDGNIDVQEFLDPATSKMPISTEDITGADTTVSRQIVTKKRKKIYREVADINKITNKNQFKGQSGSTLADSITSILQSVKEKKINTNPSSVQSRVLVNELTTQLQQSSLPRTRNLESMAKTFVNISNRDKGKIKRRVSQVIGN